ncbi:MAG: type III-A CRISPR-associated protein Cas10/Csm1 [Rhizonema sp. PD38]|nr:type III-A CRISPR-associated protein Cas10/Csm1 [Rhizonema sp. PD38]
MTQPKPTFDAALRIAQQAVTVLVKWAGAELANECRFPDDCDATEQAKKILNWCDRSQLEQPPDNILQPLRLLFDSVKLEQGQQRVHYWQAQAIANNNLVIPYPQIEKPAPTEFRELKQQIQEALKPLDNNDWQNLSLLTLILEKFGSFISFGESDVALVDIARTTAAIAAALAHNSAATQLSLVAGDLSGIQKFIYTISSDGALKSLRARSFYLELVTEEVVQQLLALLQLPRTNVIYAGGGNLYLLAPETKETENIVEQVRQQFNKWLLDEFQGKVFLALDHVSFSIEDITNANFAKHWSNVTSKLATHKSRKFANYINDFIQQRDSHEPCRVCHRDDVENLKQLNPKEADSVLACETCCTMFSLGGQLLHVEAIVRSQRKDIQGALHTISFKLPHTNVYYHLFSTWKQIVPDSDIALLVNDWTIEHYKFRHFRNSVPLLLGNYGKQTENPEETGFMRATEMAETAKGISRVGFLRMDVDRLGRIFAEGLDKKTLPRIAGLSRQISYFFKVYLNRLAAARKENVFNTIKQLTPEDDRLNLLFIYAGGDDLFVSGAWDEVVEFAFDVYQCFRAYTGYNPDITLSAGISLADAKFPLYLAAKESGEAEDSAKGNGRDSLSLFEKAFKWSEWLGSENINARDLEVFDTDIKAYLGTEHKLDLFGVFPLVNIIEKQQIEINYARSFIRNLLNTAQIQEQMIEEIEEQRKKQHYENQLKDIRYYLHLPKIAYTLARLPNHIIDNHSFTPIRKSLMNQYNAPYFRAIATWIELLNRHKNNDTTNSKI